MGLTWQPNSDAFQFTSWPMFTHSITKRTVLSEIAQLYDPLGFMSPVIIWAKIFIQEFWLVKVDWDEPLSKDLQAHWTNFRQLSSLDKVNIPRWIHFSSLVHDIEIHGFADASSLAMAAVIYIRAATTKGEVFVSLVCAKTKVAPIKQMTIPRLELTAALMLSKLASKVQQTLDVSKCSLYLWTDSSVTLHWISSHPSKWKEFIRNRTTAIHEIVPSASWKFVPGKTNPADCATRGISADQLPQLSLWWSRSSWLSQSLNFWPPQKVILPQDTNLEEKSITAMIATQNTALLYWELVQRYSSLKKLLRVTVLCKRAITRFRGIASKTLDCPITPIDLKSSTQFWIHHIQSTYFHKELNSLSGGNPLPRSNHLIRLTPFVDEHGLLRVGGRLHHAHLDPDFKHPYILPKFSPFTTLVTADAHLRTLHGGTQITLAYTRQSYWILGGRTTVRSFILRCTRCTRHRKHRAQQLMGQLLLTRITPSRPFLHTGVDYAGPVSIKTWHG